MHQVTSNEHYSLTTCIKLQLPIDAINMSLMSIMWPTLACKSESIKCLKKSQVDTPWKVPSSLHDENLCHNWCNQVKVISYVNSIIDTVSSYRWSPCLPSRGPQRGRSRNTCSSPVRNTQQGPPRARSRKLSGEGLARDSVSPLAENFLGRWWRHPSPWSRRLC